eukprot:GHVT01099829.1.p1 GENE.GHVT01099829.1~~GHVT01099829.1.p1  ORF type:complete len:117 (-),score=11.68 GHVT01099829.1:191-541(-)
MRSSCSWIARRQVLAKACDEQRAASFSALANTSDCCYRLASPPGMGYFAPSGVSGFPPSSQRLANWKSQRFISGLLAHVAASSSSLYVSTTLIAAQFLSGSCLAKPCLPCRYYQRS